MDCGAGPCDCESPGTVCDSGSAAKWVSADRVGELEALGNRLAPWITTSPGCLWQPPSTKAENLLFALESKTTPTPTPSASCLGNGNGNGFEAKHVHQNLRSATASAAQIQIHLQSQIQIQLHIQAQLICKFQRNTVPQNFNDHLEFSLGVSAYPRPQLLSVQQHESIA